MLSFKRNIIYFSIVKLIIEKFNMFVTDVILITLQLSIKTYKRE